METTALMAQAQKDILTSKESFNVSMCNNISKVFMLVGNEWQKAHPKRHLKLVSGMGVLFWVIDDSILQHDHKLYFTNNGYNMNYEGKLSCSWEGWKNCGLSDHEKQAQFRPLLNALEWLESVLDDSEYMDKYLEDMDFKK